MDRKYDILESVCKRLEKAERGAARAVMKIEEHFSAVAPPTVKIGDNRLFV